MCERHGGSGGLRRHSWKHSRPLPAQVIDAESRAFRTAERAEVIGRSIDGTVWSRAKSVEDCAVARGSKADHLAQITDTPRLALRTAKCAEIVNGGIDGILRLCTKSMQWRAICDCSRPGHLAQVVNTLGVTLPTAKRAEVIGGRIDGTVGRSPKGTVTVVSARRELAACHLALGVHGVAREPTGTAERAEVGYEMSDLGA